MAEEQKADQAQQIDMDPGAALERIDAWVDGLVRITPNIIVAILVFGLFVGAGLLARRIIVSRSVSGGRENLGTVLGGFARWAIIIVGALIAATIVVPTLNPGDLIAGLGVSSVAIGFAFKDILQNWLAGLLILVRQPFEIEDQIEVNDFEGTVERIETRATIIKTYDNQRVVIPNSDIYTNAVLVKTANEKRRSQYDIGIGYSDSIDEACEVIREAIGKVEQVEKDPAPEALPWSLAASWVTIRARWWTGARRSEVVHARAGVVRAVKEALDAASIDMPYETHVQLLHDQTEDQDGDRDGQREGWPRPADGASTRPRWRAMKPENGGDSAS